MAYFEDQWQDVQLRTADAMPGGQRVTGPAIVDLGEATCLVRPGWTASPDVTGALVLERR